MIVSGNYPLSSVHAKQVLDVAKDKLTEDEYSKLMELLEYWEQHGTISI